MKSLFAVAFGLATIFTATPAHALRVSLVGAANYSTPETKPAWDFNGKPAFGGGALLELGFIPGLGLETGALWLPRKYEVLNAGYTYTTEQNMVQVPLMLRARLANVFSLGIGGYYATYTGNIEYQRDRLGSVPVVDTYGNQALSSDDYGVIASVAFYSSLTPLARFMLDARYVIGVKDNDNLFYEKKFRDIQILMGLQFGL